MRSPRLLFWILFTVCGLGLYGALRAGRRQGETTGTPAIEVHGESYPLLVLSAQGKQRIERAPQRILPAFASALELLVDLVPKERIVAIPKTASEWSVLASEHQDWLSLPELESFSAEAVLAHKPDLVLVQSWLGATTIDALQRSGQCVIELPLPLDWPGLLHSLRALAAVLDTRQEAELLIARLEARRAALLRTPKPPWRALCYSNWGSGGTTAGTESTGDLLLELAGLRNAARELGLRGNPNLDHESILKLAPDLFVVASAPEGSLSPSADYLLHDRHLAELSALRAGRIITLPMHLFSTASHRILDAAELLAQEVARLQAAED